MRKILAPTTLLLCLFAFSEFAAADARLPPPLRQVEVSGMGKITQQPDMATTSFTFSQRANQAAQGKTLIDTQVTNLLKLCQKLGIKEADIHAAKLNVYPEYDYKRNRELIGYNVSRAVEVKVRDLQQYPRLLDGAVGIGASHSGSLTLDFSNRESLENDAMLKAFQNAKQKATLLAQQANSKLGEALWISETGNAPPMPIHTPMRMAATAESSDAAYPTGDIELTKHLLVRFKLED